ncbi:MAG: hypothetical protein LBK18_09745 [Prevotellaceae bacterium]|jgi:hypothetical protein|nr:hypothetical protein [Prevotellaceae bacterium]
MGKIETIFDYNPSKGELRRFNITSQEEANSVKGLYQKYPDEAHDSICYQLGLLFLMRLDRKKAKMYFDRMKDKAMLSTLVQDF